MLGMGIYWMNLLYTAVVLMKSGATDSMKALEDRNVKIDNLNGTVRYLDILKHQR